jgi:CPA1 family monovalent cation:H+ antiporter
VDGESTLGLIRAVVLMVGATAAVSLIARRFSIPLTVALVAFGLLGGTFLRTPGSELPSELVLAVLLPGLIFEAAYRLDIRLLRSSLLSVGVLAGPGVLVVAVIVGLALQVAVGMPLAIGFVAGAIVAATDPAAVIASFKRLHAPRRLSTLVEAESLFNDGTGIVLFTIAIAAVGRPIGLLDGLWTFVVTVVASSAIGIASGVVASWLIVRVRDHLVELSISLVLAYGSALLAQAVGQSGIIAAAVAGITLGNYGRTLGLSSRTLEALDTVWEFLAFLLSALLFLLVGAAIPVVELLGAIGPIAGAVVAVQVSRALLVYGVVGGLGRLLGGRAGSDVPMAWRHVVFWSGLRGAVSVALALALPHDFPQRALVQQIVFGVVLFTLAVQASTVDNVLSRLKIGHPERDLGSA